VFLFLDLPISRDVVESCEARQCIWSRVRLLFNSDHRMAKPKRSSRQQSSSKVRSSRQSAVVTSELPIISGKPEAILWGLLIARWLTPTEGTVQGDTLWLTSLTLAAAAGFCWWMSRVSLERFRFGKLDAAVWLLCGSHILSSLVVIMTEGNKRSATNMLWEWLGIAVTFSLLRQTITAESRARFLQTAVVVVAALACYGIWQPAFWYPSQLREYENLRAELTAVESSSELSPQEQAKRRLELRAEFVSRGIPLSGPSLQLFERRLRDSKEPLGFFALTNTFAAFMATSLVLLAGAMLRELLPKDAASRASPERNNRGLLCALGIALLLVAYCLLLTKSRSAWGGTLVGMATLVLLLLATSNSGAAFRKLIPIIAIGAVAMMVIAGVAIASGALDVEVLTEASTSLFYRLEYWTSTWDVIQDNPVFGTGPGNFRDHYLRFKLPQSSEEISDPHQFILDVAANAGLVGLIGLGAVFAVVASLAWPVCKSDRSAATSGSTVAASLPPSEKTSARGAIGVATLIIFAGGWLFSGALEWNVLCVGILAIVIDFLLVKSLLRSSPDANRTPASLTIPPVALIASLVAVFVHLSAAGGIAMPAVIGLALVLAAVLQVDSDQERRPNGDHEKAPEGNDAARTGTESYAATGSYNTGLWLGVALASGLAAVGCTTTAFSPVMRSTSLFQLGDYEAVTGQPIRRVVGHYRDAAEADNLSPEPHLRLSQFYLHQWKQTRDSTYFEQSIEHATKARSLSPNSPQVAHEIGYAWLVRASGDASGNASATAVAELQHALEMYPTQPTWTAETVQALELAGESSKAAELARRALELEKINRAAGHVDRYLADDLLIEVKRLANQ
jgi:O-antigen ligase